MSRERGWRSAAVMLVVLLLPYATTHAGPQDRERATPGQENYARTPVELVPYSRALEPYRRFFLTPPAYRGPSRDKLPPAGVETVRIGLLAPLQGTPDDALGASLLHGVELALDEANQAGGYQGLPFELVARNDQAIWGSSSNTLVRFAYEDRVWAVIGSIDSNSTHVALRAALKAELPMVNVGSTDPTVTETAIPWIIRTTPDDRQTGYRLARRVFVERELRRVAVLRSSDRYGRFGIKEFRDAARRLQRPLAMEVLFVPGRDDFGAEIERIVSTEVEAIVLWASARDAARIVQQVRARGLEVPIFGTDRLVSDEFLEAAGADAEGIEATAWMMPGRTDSTWEAFAARYRERHGVDPDTWAAYAYDAAVLTIGAIRTAGLNHARIMDALGGIERYQGVAGPMTFDATWNNIAAPLMARVVDGRFVRVDEVDDVALLAVPADAEPLRIGLLSEGGSPDDPFLQGARRAAAVINRGGGVDGRPLEILVLEAGSPWSDGASRIARLSATDGLIALVGGTDGATAHVAAQVATRRRIPYLSTSPEESLTRAGDRWVLRVMPSDADQAEAVLRATFAQPSVARVAAVVPDGREGRERLRALREACERTGTTLLTGDSSAPAGQPTADAILLWLDPEPAIEWLGRLEPSERRPLLGSTRLDEPELLRAVARGSLRLLVPTMSPAGAGTSIAASERSLPARLGHDLVQLVADAAIGVADDPDQLLSHLLATPLLSGRTGTLSFDTRGNRIGELTILELPRRGQTRPGERP